MGDCVAYRELQSLVISFGEATPKPYRVVVSKCTVHGQPIAALYGLDQALPGSEAVTAHGREWGQLYADRGYFANKKRNVESLTDGLWKVFGPWLVRGDYSFRANAYRQFSSDELTFIADAEAWAAKADRR